MPSNIATLTKTVFSRNRFLFSLGWAPALVWCVHQVSAWITGGEYWWDEPMHLAGGAAIAWMWYAGLRYAQIHGYLPVMPRWFYLVTGIGSVMIAGVVWEWYEYIRWITIDPSMDLTLQDTLKDLIMDTVGGAVVGFAYKNPSS